MFKSQVDKSFSSPFSNTCLSCLRSELETLGNCFHVKDTMGEGHGHTRGFALKSFPSRWLENWKVLKVSQGGMNYVPV